jgi:hypothetical protein
MLFSERIKSSETNVLAKKANRRNWTCSRGVCGVSCFGESATSTQSEWPEVESWALGRKRARKRKAPAVLTDEMENGVRQLVWRATGRSLQEDTMKASYFRWAPLTEDAYPAY